MTAREEVRIGDKIVAKYQIIGERRFIFQAWEPSTVAKGHHVITHFGDKCFGMIGSRDIPAEVERMKGGSPERIEACRARRAAQAKEAIALIREAFPETRNVEPRPDDCELEITER